MRFGVLLVLACSFVAIGGFSQEEKPKSEDKPQPKPKPKAKVVGFSTPALELPSAPLQLSKPGKQLDLPAAVAAPNDRIWVGYLEWNGQSDALRLAEQTEDGLADVATLVEDGLLHQPTLAVDGSGTVWCIYGETNVEDDTVNLLALPWTAEGGVGEAVVLADSDASEAFAQARTDAEGRVWVTWQSLRAGEGDIYARYYEDGRWSEELAVCIQPGGEWEPSIACVGGDAWILYDSSRGGEFNLYLAKVSSDGTVEEVPIAHSEHLEARGSLAAAADGSGLWIAAERGKRRWGLDARGHGNATGINAGKSILFGKYDFATQRFTEIPMGTAGEAGNPVNVPVVGVGRDGNPWVAYRYFKSALWRIALSAYRQDSETWSARRRLENSSYGQDRLAMFLPPVGDGDARFCWASDQRLHKAHQTASVFLAELPASTSLPEATPPKAKKPQDAVDYPLSQNTPERPADDRHTWQVDGKSYGLYWGDVHRHTDVSNCRTGYDGCIMDHFRYAYDLAKIDWLGTSDHTDIGKIYHPYEWWHNQRMHDALHSPGRFNTVYVYEREQRWPWGHRNVVFSQRGGPIVYIKRTTYRNSPWQSQYPVKAGLNEIQPTELWDLLAGLDQPVAVISHTGATGMGTDWGKYETGIDHRVENVVEIFQAARVSYEGAGAPQPTAGMKDGQAYTINGDAKATAPEPIMDFGKFSGGTYQNALDLGRQLGVFTSSDHIAQHTSYGGVYCEEFTREGIIEALKQRRTIAATDRIYLNFTANDQPLGSIFESGEDAKLWFRVDGTAPIKRITIVRNEKDWKEYHDLEAKQFETEIVDTEMLDGENRYYVRVVQADGNMAWSSPIWITRK